MGKTLGDLLRELSEAEGSRSRAAVRIYGDVRRGALKLRDPEPPAGFLRYAARLDYSLWFWALVSSVAAALATIYISPAAPWLTPLRYVFGTVFTLFLPGYSAIQALYPDERSLAPLERLALSVGLSLAILPLLGLVLNYTPWGIALDPVVLSTASLTLSLAVAALYRRYSLHAARRAAEGSGAEERARAR